MLTNRSGTTDGSCVQRSSKRRILCLPVSALLFLACSSGEVTDDGGTGGSAAADESGGSTGVGASDSVGSNSGGSNSGGSNSGGSNAGGSNSGGSNSGGSNSSGGESGTSGGAPGTGGDPGAGGGGSDLGGATILNDSWWEDTSGTPIYSQGGGVLQVGDTYYWYGVHYAGAQPYIDNPQGGKNGNIGFVGVTTYSSKDLVNWEHEATDQLENAGGWFGRLGVAYNENTEKYVLVAQGGGGHYFATSDSPDGGFVYDNVQFNPPGIANGSTGDQTVFQDDDGQAYVVSSSSSGRSHRYLSPLRASDFLRMEEAIPVYSGGGREGNCMFKYEGTYYFCSSDLHGWNTSQTYCVSATDIHGPWSEEFVMRGSEADYSHVTQTGFFVQVYGTEQTTIIFAGDRWADFAGNGIGYNQWVPLSFQGDEPIFNSLSAWTLNATTGRWSVAPENNWVLNPSFEADRIDVATPVGWSAANGTNSQDPYSGRWSWYLDGNADLSQTIEDIPNGTYTLRVWSKGDAAGAELFARDSGGARQTTSIPGGSSWHEVSLENVEVTSGQVDVGVTTRGQGVNVDNFSLLVVSE